MSLVLAEGLKLADRVWVPDYLKGEIGNGTEEADVTCVDKVDAFLDPSGMCDRRRSTGACGSRVWVVGGGETRGVRLMCRREGAKPRVE